MLRTLSAPLEDDLRAGNLAVVAEGHVPHRRAIAVELPQAFFDDAGDPQLFVGLTGFEPTTP